MTGKEDQTVLATGQGRVLARPGRAGEIVRAVGGDQAALTGNVAGENAARSCESATSPAMGGGDGQWSTCVRCNVKNWKN